MIDTPGVLLVSLVISMIISSFALAHAVLAVRRLSVVRTIENAMGALTAVALLVVAIGLAIGAVGLIINDFRAAAVGLAMARGAMLVLVTTLVVIEFIQLRR